MNFSTPFAPSGRARIFQCLALFLALFSPFFRLIYIGLGNTLMVGGAFYLMAAVIHFRTRRAFAN